MMPPEPTAPAAALDGGPFVPAPDGGPFVPAAIPGVRVCVEGNIGSGKSTAMRLAAEARPGLPAFPEPVAEWRELLRRFYADPARWALALSERVLLSFGPPGRHPGPCLVERSPESCRHVFGRMHYKDGTLTSDEWDLFKDLADLLGWRPSAIVYVYTPAAECLERTRLRGRPEEAAVDLEYLRRVEFQYETLLKFVGVPVYRVDGTQPPEQVAREVLAALDDFVSGSGPGSGPGSSSG
jgi:deoxyadenosine/deoxycytidine kinase